MHTVPAGLQLAWCSPSAAPQHVQEHGEVVGPEASLNVASSLSSLTLILPVAGMGGGGGGSRGRSISCPGGLVVGTGTPGLPRSVILQVSPTPVAMGTVCKHSRFSWETGHHCPPLRSLSAHLGWVSCVFPCADHRAGGQNTPPA